MAQGYYTLEEAARIVGVSTEDLKQMARRGEIRSFQDRGTWRFRNQDVEEMARRRSGGRSDPDLTLGEAPQPKPTDSPAIRGPKSPPKTREGDVFDFGLDVDDEDIGLGSEFQLELPGSSKKQAGKSKPPAGSGRSPRPGTSAPKSAPSPVPPAGSDSDVKLVTEGSETFQLAPDSDVRKPDSSRQPKSKPPAGTPKSDQRRKSGLSSPGSADSGVRLVPMESDSDVRLVGQGSSDEMVPLGSSPPPSGTDSDVRLEKRSKLGGKSPADSQDMLTDEINLDEELKKQEQKQKQKQKQKRKSGPGSKVIPKGQAPAPPPTPFELSEHDLGLPDSKKAGEEVADSSDMELTPMGLSPIEPSSDFELTPAGKKATLGGGSGEDEFRLDLPDDEVGLADLDPAPQLKGPSSGIRLDKPQDGGISLEQGGEGSDEIEFNISLDPGTTPKPGAEPPESSEFELTLDGDSSPTDSSSEFELTLDSSPTDSSSEFELTLDAGTESGSESDSEFELTLDDSGSLSPVESSEKDIFQTEFEVPSLEEESGSEAVALESADTDLESSDFDIAIEDDSGSAVVQLDDDLMVEDDAGETVTQQKARARRTAVARQQPDDFEELGDELVEAEGEEPVGPTRTVVKEKILPAAPWGPVPVLFLLPCAIVMFFVTLMGYELVQSMSGYKSPGLITRTVGGLIAPEKFKGM